MKITVTDRSDLDPVSRKLYSVNYDGSDYWFRPRANRMDLWVAVKDDSDNEEYPTYYLDIRNKISCTCDGYRRAHKCRHTEMLQEIKSKFK